MVKHTMNEITRSDNDRILQLLQQLKLRLPATQFQRVANFIHMERLDPYTTLKDIGEHLKMQFPELFREMPVTDESVMLEQGAPESSNTWTDRFTDPKWLELKKLIPPMNFQPMDLSKQMGTADKPASHGYHAWKTKYGLLDIYTTPENDFSPEKINLRLMGGEWHQEKVKQLQDFFDKHNVRNERLEINGSEGEAGATISLSSLTTAAKIINGAVKILSGDHMTTESRIRLKDLVLEITLNNIEPYTTQITWEDSNMGYEFQFQDDAGNWISVFMADNGGYDEADDPIYEVSFFVKTPTSGGVYSANKTVSGTTANYLRIMATVGAAIMDFLTRFEPYFVEFTGADSDPKKAAQKTRLYSQFARDNAGKLRSLGYRFVSNHMGTGLERID